MDKIKIKKNSGFTLIEMLVSLTLYTFVITMALGALFMIMKANEKTKLVKTVTNNINLSLESMSRELRVGEKFRVTDSNDGDCSSDTNGCTKITFKTKEGCDGASYYLENSQIYRFLPRKDKSTNRCNNGITPVVITGDEGVVVEFLRFYLTGAEKDDGSHPKVTILLRAKAKMDSGLISGDEEIFHIQTTISQRGLED